MRAVVQRVTHASVTVDGELLGRIGKGFMILLGVADGDTVQLAEKMADKICRLRIFEDENGKTNLSLADVEGELLIISQFTLYADCHKGNRPSFTKACGHDEKRAGENGNQDPQHWPGPGDGNRGISGGNGRIPAPGYGWQRRQKPS